MNFYDSKILKDPFTKLNKQQSIKTSKLNFNNLLAYNTFKKFMNSYLKKIVIKIKYKKINKKIL